MRLLLLLFLGFTFFSCKNKDCIPTPCAPPNLNMESKFDIHFCLDDAPNCFRENELTEVIFTEWDINSGELVQKFEIDNLEDANYVISIGSGVSPLKFSFGDDSKDPLLQVQYFYEIEIPQINKNYRIDNFQFEEEEPCSCIETIIESIDLDGTSIEVSDNSFVLSKT